MNSTPPNSPRGDSHPSAPNQPPRVPDHELLRRIGKGAYGEVWLARCTLGSYRAVKIVHRQSFDHDRPFEREFEGIRKFEPVSRTHDSQVDILHVGRGEDCFYYVMELADDQATGGQINPDHYAPRTLKSDLQFHGRLPFEECVRIGVALTTALEHLHAHGLVHRDVKPSNIIFVNGVPKLADIGLVTGIDATHTFVGTEGFAAPEGSGTAQADLFSLGKVLYEAATGKDRQAFPELPTLLRELPDREGLMELNAVIAKACRHDPKDRYTSGAAMRAELELLQSGKSLARLHRMEARLRFVTRFAMIVVAILVLGAFPYFWAIKSAHGANQSAKMATTEAGKSREVAAFLKQMFESVRQSATMGQDTAMMKGILDRAKARVSQDLKEQPDVQADLLNTIGKIAFDLGEGAEAIEDLSEAVRLRRSLFGETNLLVAESLFWLGAAQELQGEGRNARSAIGQALAIRRELLGEEHPETALALSAYGTLIRAWPQEAEVALREALRLLQKHYPEGHVYVAEALDNLGLSLKLRGKLTEGEQLARQSLEMWRKLTGDENADVATAWTRLGVIVQMQERFEESEPLLREGYRQRRKFLGADHSYALSALASLATALDHQGKFAEAEQLIREHLAQCKNDDALAWVDLLATPLAGQDKFTEAQAVFRKEAELDLKRLSKPIDRSNPDALNQTAWGLATHGEPTTRDGLRAVELAGQAVAATSRTNASFLDTLAAAFAETGQFDKAVATQQEAMGRLQELREMEDYASRLKLYLAGKPYHEREFREFVPDSLAEIISSLLRREKFAEAEVPARASLDFLRKEWPEDWRTSNSQSQLGGSLLGQKKYAEAEPLLLSGYEGLKQREDQIPVKNQSCLGEALQRIVRFYQETQRPNEAAKWQAKLDEQNRVASERKILPEK